MHAPQSRTALALALFRTLARPSGRLHACGYTGLLCGAYATADECLRSRAGCVCQVKEARRARARLPKKTAAAESRAWRRTAAVKCGRAARRATSSIRAAASGPAQMNGPLTGTACRSRTCAGSSAAPEHTNTHHGREDVRRAATVAGVGAQCSCSAALLRAQSVSSPHGLLQMPAGPAGEARCHTQRHKVAIQRGRPAQSRTQPAHQTKHTNTHHAQHTMDARTRARHVSTHVQAEHRVDANHTQAALIAVTPPCPAHAAGRPARQRRPAPLAAPGGRRQGPGSQVDQRPLGCHPRRRRRHRLQRPRR